MDPVIVEKTKAEKAARKRLEALVWKHTHRDFRGVYGVAKCIMISGCRIVEIATLSDSECVARLPSAVRAAWMVTPDAPALAL